MLVEVNCETDFVARTEEFQELVKDVAMQVAAANPSYVAREEVPGEVLEKEREIYRQQMADQKKPPQVIDKIIEGKLEKFFAEPACWSSPSSRTVRQDQLKDMVDQATPPRWGADRGEALRPLPDGREQLVVAACRRGSRVPPHPAQDLGRGARGRARATASIPT